MKKIILFLLICTFILSSVTSTYANNAKAEFINAHATTFMSIAEELELINELNPTDLILKNLREDAYEFSFNFGIDTVSIFTEYLQNLQISGSQNVDFVNNKMLTNLLFDLPGKLLGSNDTGVNFNMYMDEGMIAFNSSDVSDEYFYVNYLDLKDYTNNSEIGVHELINMIEYFTRTMFNSIQLNNEIIETSRDIEKTYLKILLKMMNKAQYKDDGKGLVYYDDASVSYRKTTATISSDIANEFFSDMSQQIYNDQQLRDLLYIIYTDFEEITGMDIVEQVILSLSQIFEHMEAKYDITYSIYTNDKNQIISSEIVYNNINFKLNTKGLDYLLNNIELSLYIEDDTYDYGNGIKISMFGDIVPSDGVYNIFGNSTTYSVYENLTNDDLVVDFQFKWDITQQNDNFEFNLKSHKTELPLNEEVFYEYKLDKYITYNEYYNNFFDSLNSGLNIIGTLNVNLDDNTIITNLDNIVVNLGSETINMHLDFVYKPINGDEVKFNTQKAINFLALTE